MDMRYFFAFIGMILISVSCEKIDPQYPDKPQIDYQGFALYITTDALNNKTLIGQLSFDFTDGDGNIGLNPYTDTTNINLPDSLRYNFFLQMYNLEGYAYVKVPAGEGGVLKYRIPYLDKKPLSGTMELEISYPSIGDYDTIYYTFYIYDRDLNRSNVDTTQVIVLSGIDLEEI